MSIFRIEHTKNYTVMSNYHLREKEMSLKAKGLLSYMLSLPPNWDYSLNGLISVLKEDLRAIKSGLKELEKFGYLEIKKFYPDKKYSKIRYEYDIYEKPILKHNNQAIQNVSVDTVPVHNVPIQKALQRNTNELSTNVINTKKEILISSNEKILKNSKSEKPKKSNEERVARETRLRELKKIFMDEIWERYPLSHRVGEKVCFSKFKSAVSKGVAIEEIIEGFNRYLKVIEINQRKGTEQFIKRLDNWFAAESWKNPNLLMVSQADSKLQHQMNSKYPSQNYCGLPPVFQQSMYNEPRIDIEVEDWGNESH